MIEEISRQHPNWAIASSLPGAGPVMAPRLLAAMGSGNYLRAGGKQHHAAIRALAFKWQRILFRCWKDQAPYDESKYLAALKKRNSPLLAWLPA